MQSEKVKKYSCETCGRAINHRGNCFACNLKKKSDAKMRDFSSPSKDDGIKKVNEKLVSKDKVYSVDEATNYLKGLIVNDRILQNIWIKGEVSNFIHSRGIHMYFSLKDENAVIDCAMFKNLNQDLKFLPGDGMNVIIKGKIDIYKQRGKYQLIVEEIHDAGKGELYIRFLQLKNKLEKEGLFREDHKRPIPKYPLSLGIVTSLQGAVIQDILKVIKRRYPHIKILIYPSLVQGNTAKENIVRGINALNGFNLDLIILARGGGSLEDLWPFNEEIVVRAIYNSNIPIISAVGHETDVTLSDFVADKRAPTPSVAAEIAVPDEKEVLGSLAHMEGRIFRQINNILEDKRSSLKNIITRPLFKKPYNLINPYKQNFDDLAIQLIEVVNERTENLQGGLDYLDVRLKALNPKSILKRGYSMTLKDDKIVSSINNINAEDVLVTVFKDGKIKSRVMDKNGREII